MIASAPRRIAKLLYAPILAVGMLFASSSGGFSSSIPPGHTPASLKLIVHQTIPVETIPVASIPSELDKEEAMSPSRLMDRWTPLIKEASHRFGISEDWIRAVMRMESGGRTLLNDGRPITSKAGAMGIMQIMPDTYDDMRQQFELRADPYDPHDNVLAGTAYLRWLYGKYGYPKLFAAYNAGPGTLEAQLAGARRMPAETRAYVRGIAQILGMDSESSASESISSRPANVPATLTRPDGSPVSIDGTTVDSIRASFPGEYAPGVQTVLAMGNRRQGVCEDVATVASILKSHGGSV